MNIEIGKYVNSTIPFSKSGMPVYVGLPRKEEESYAQHLLIVV